MLILSATIFLLLCDLTFFTMQCNSRWNISNHKMSEEKEQKLINTNAITRHNTIAMYRDQQSWRSSFSLFQAC